MSPLVFLVAAIASIGIAFLGLAGMAAPFPGARESVAGLLRFSAFFLGLAILVALAVGAAMAGLVPS